MSEDDDKDEPPYWLRKPPPTTVRRVRADVDDLLRLLDDAATGLMLQEGRGMTYDEVIAARDPVFEARDLAQRLDEAVSRLSDWIVDNLPEAE